MAEEDICKVYAMASWLLLNTITIAFIHFWILVSFLYLFLFGNKQTFLHRKGYRSPRESGLQTDEILDHLPLEMELVSVVWHIWVLSSGINFFPNRKRRIYVDVVGVARGEGDWRELTGYSRYLPLVDYPSFECLLNLEGTPR